MTCHFDVDKIHPPEDIEGIINMDSSTFASIDDDMFALALQHKLAQYSTYLRAQYNLSKASLSDVTDEFEEKLYEAISIMPKSWTVKEKTLKAASESDHLKELKCKMQELKRNVETLSEMDDRVKMIHDTVKQLYYRIRRVSYDE